MDRKKGKGARDREKKRRNESGREGKRKKGRKLRAKTNNIQMTHHIICSTVVGHTC